MSFPVEEHSPVNEEYGLVCIDVSALIDMGERDLSML